MSSSSSSVSPSVNDGEVKFGEGCYKPTIINNNSENNTGNLMFFCRNRIEHLINTIVMRCVSNSKFSLFYFDS